MTEMRLDLKKIPDTLPHGNYRNWLVWKLRSMHTNESLKLPIFSALTIRRYKDGFSLDFAGKYYGFTDMEALMKFIEFDSYIPNSQASRLANIAQVNRLFEQRKSIMQIAKETGLSWQLVNRYLNTTTSLIALDTRMLSKAQPQNAVDAMRL